MYDDMDMTIGPDYSIDAWEQQMLPDTCAVVSEMSIINQFGYDLTQDQASFISAEHGWYHPGGGTPMGDIGNMMDLYNIPNHTVFDATIKDLAAELQAGHGVIVGVNSSELWKTGPLADLNEFLCETFGIDNPADHAVVVTGIDVSDPSQPMVVINDSGHPDGAGARYPLDQFIDAWENSGFYYTATDNPIPSNDIETIGGLEDWGKWLTGGIVGGTIFAATGNPFVAIGAGLTAGNLVENFFSDPEAVRLI